MTLSDRRGWATALGMSLAAYSALPAQKPNLNPDAAEVAALLRNRGHYGAAVSVLTQARGPQPRARMDEIADSLVAIAVSFPGNDLRGVRTRAAAQIALVHAGNGETGIVGVDRAIPYVGAADRLMQIASTAEDVGIRSAALLGLTELPDKTKLFPFLSDVAASQNPVAYSALTLLANDTGPEGQNVARMLYRAGRITEPTAKEIAARLAEGYGWR